MNVKFELKQIEEHLVGKTITGSVTSDEGYFGFTVGEGAEKLIVWVDGDEEANSVGHLSITK